MRRLPSLVLSSVSLAALVAPAAHAQVAGAPVESTPEATAEAEEAPPADEVPTTAEGAPADEGEIIVTGSRLRRNNYNTPSPVAVYTREDSVLAGVTSTAETLQSASVTSGTSQIGSAFLGFLTEGGQGANTVGLRGLGSQRTLVLLNGRRLAPAGVGSQLVAADLNVIPTSVVQRIEVLREGASAIYGSDAIAGVINVITDTKLNGITLDAFGDGPFELNGSAGRSWRGAVTAGKTFDRGYILGSFEYRKRNGARFRDNDDWSCPRAGLRQNGQEVGQVDPATGELACFSFGPNEVAGSGIASGYGLGGYLRFDGGITAFTRATYIDGDITNATTVNNFYSRPIQGGLDSQLASHVISPVETYTGYVSGGYELEALGDAELYGEMLYTKRKSAQESATQFSVTPSALNPLIEIYGGTQYYTGLPIGQYAPPPVGGSQLPNYQESPFYPVAFDSLYVNRFTPFILPNQLQEARQSVEFWRANGGLRGQLGIGDWRYDANVQFSRTRASEKLANPTVTTASNVLMTELAPAGTPANLIVVAAPGTAGAGGSYTCASNVTNGAYNGGECIPLNIFDPDVLLNGNIPQATYDYLFVPQTQRTRFNQETFSAIFDGTLLNLPAGPMRGAIGFEYRRDEINNVPSEDAQAGQLYNRTNEGITRGKDNVKEVFAELNIPLMRDKPGVHNLEFAASGRYTSYKSYGSQFVYRVNGQYSPVEMLRFRGSLGTNFRAPNLYEQFVNNQQGFFGGASDPCSGFSTLSPTSNNYQNCLSELTPILDNPETPENEALDFLNASSIIANTSGGRDNIDAETATSYGFGVVVTVPRHIVDLSIAVDYFNTRVKDEVSNLGLSNLNFCYDEDPAVFAAGGGNYCPLINGRFGAGATYPGTLISFQSPYINLAQQVVSGVDFNVRLASDLFNGRFQTQLQATRMLKQQLESFAGSGLFEYNGTLGYPGFGSGPKWTANLDTRFTFGAVTLRHGLEYIGRASAERLVELAGLGSLCDFGEPCPDNPLLGVPGDPYTEDLVAEAYWEHSLSAQYKFREKAQITVGVKNLFNAKPPKISDSQDSFGQYFRIGNYFGGGPYDYLGRSVFLNVTSSF